MEIVPLVEYELPRVLVIDFSKARVEKISTEGFNVRRGFSGIHDQNKFSLPLAKQDVEIVFLECNEGFIKEIKDKQKDDSSIESGFYIAALLEEVWDKQGFSVLFIKEGLSPSEIELIGISNLGVLHHQGKYYPARLYKEHQNNPQGRNAASIPEPCFRRFKGQNINTPEEDIFINVLKPHLKNADFLTLSVEKNTKIFNRDPSCEKWLITDNAKNQGALAIWLGRYKDKGGILILPSFGDKNIDIAISLLQKVFPGLNPDLFSGPEHSWLKNYRPYGVTIIDKQKNEFIEEALKRIETFDQQIQNENRIYSWMDLILVGSGDDFTRAVADALTFLEFKVELIDKQLAPGERKREDLRIIDDQDSFFALGEAKSTTRGASENFITDTQIHQARYSKENKCTIPYAILIINHSYSLEPDQRAARFYNHQAISDRCNDSSIIPIDSVFLHNLCQQVLARKLTRDSAREIIKTGSNLSAT